MGRTNCAFAAGLATWLINKIKDMRRPRLQNSRTFIGKVVTLIHSGHSSKLRRLVAKKLVRDNRVDAEAREGRDTGSPDIV
jgi:hypothetical protein